MTSTAGFGQSNMLNTGIVELISWRADETERPLDNVEYTQIVSRDGGYEIKICFKTNQKGNDIADYFLFKIKNIKTADNITKAKLTDISIENTDIIYFDDKASGTIEINHQTDLVKIVFQHTTYHQKTQYEIVWKQ